MTVVTFSGKLTVKALTAANVVLASTVIDNATGLYTLGAVVPVYSKLGLYTGGSGNTLVLTEGFDGSTANVAFTGQLSMLANYFSQTAVNKLNTTLTVKALRTDNSVITQANLDPDTMFYLLNVTEACTKFGLYAGATLLGTEVMDPGFPAGGGSITSKLSLLANYQTPDN